MGYLLLHIDFAFTECQTFYQTIIMKLKDLFSVGKEQKTSPWNITFLSNF